MRASVARMGCGSTTMAANASAGDNDTTQEPKQLGFHITAIRKFIADHPEVKTEHLTTSQTNRTVVKPETKGLYSSYIEKYRQTCNETTSGPPLVDTATVFVSHAWQYAFYDVVVDVMEQYALDNPDAYFWFDLFTNNQNEMANKDFDWFCLTFRNGIVDIGQVLLVLSPWNDPKPIKRCWCLFEIFNSLEESEVKFTINLPRAEVEELRSGVIEDAGSVIQALSDIQAEKAEAKSETDKEMIFDVIRKSSGGFEYVNKQVKTGLRRWYIDQLKSLIAKEETITTLRMNSGIVMKDFGYFDDALYYWEESLKIAQNQLGEDNSVVAGSYNNIATVYVDMGDLDKAADYYDKSLAINLKIYGKEHPQIADAYNNFASIYSRKGDFDKAIEYNEKCLTLRLQSLGENHPDIAASYNNIGNIHCDKNDYEKALKFHNKALTIRFKALGENHPDVAASYLNVAVAYQMQGEYDKALEIYNSSLAIMSNTLGENHPNIATVINNIAMIHKDRGDPNKALEYYHKSLTIKLKTYNENHPEVAQAYFNIANVYIDKNDAVNALKYNNKSLSIKVKVFGYNHPGVADTMENLGLLYGAIKDFDSALEHFNKTVEIRQIVFGQDHPRTETARSHADRITRAREQHESA